MIAALILDRSENKPFTGRTIIPLLGRPWMVYPILAAQHSQGVQKVFFSTDDSRMADIARHHGCQVIGRPDASKGADVSVGEILGHGYREIKQSLGLAPQFLVVLYADAPMVTRGMIDEGVTLLQKLPAVDAAISVGVNRAYHPQMALRLSEQGFLESFLETAGNQNLQKAYFPNALLQILRPTCLEEPQIPSAVSSPGELDVGRHRVVPLIHEGSDCPWQVPAVEDWLRRQGFDETRSPYGSNVSDVPEKDIDWRQSIESIPPDQCVLVTTVPYCDVDVSPLRSLREAGLTVVVNPLGRRMKEEELEKMIGDFGFLIAGTEPITARVLAAAHHLKLIARVGIGLDNVDLPSARDRGIGVTYTPDAPAAAVAELTVGLMISVLRHIVQADRNMRNGIWHRFMGQRLVGKTIGVVGVGRVGKGVIRHLANGFPGVRLLANDLFPDEAFGKEHGVQWMDKPTLFSESDIISLHVPLNPATRGLINGTTIATMKPTSVLVNTSRGEVVCERELAFALREGRLAGAAVDVFDREPYTGELTTLDRCVLTSHMGSMTMDCRLRMEREATEDIVRFVQGLPLLRPVPLGSS